MTPFPPIERWRIPEAACEHTREAVLPAGRRGSESGVIWLGTRASTSIVRTVAKPVGAGVVERPWKWSVSPEVYAAVGAYAKPRGLVLLAVVHTHLSRQVPRMSPTDRTHGLKVEDALAIIIGSAGEERDSARWGWFIYEAGDHRELAYEERIERIAITGDTADFVEISAGKRHDVG